MTEIVQDLFGTYLLLYTYTTETGEAQQQVIFYGTQRQVEQAQQQFEQEGK